MSAAPCRCCGRVWTAGGVLCHGCAPALAAPEPLLVTKRLTADELVELHLWLVLLAGVTLEAARLRYLEEALC